MRSERSANGMGLVTVLPPQTVTQHRNTTAWMGYGPVALDHWPNEADACLLDDLLYWEYILSLGGLETCCPKGRKPYANRPWIAMPAEGRRFKPIGTLAVPNLADPANLNTDITVLQVQVPKGYNGVITDVVCEITAAGATGLVDGSGDITWRLSANQRYLRDMGNITTTLGSLTAPNPVPRGGLRVYSSNLLKFTVNFDNAAALNINPAGIIICSITGWYYPR